MARIRVASLVAALAVAGCGTTSGDEFAASGAGYVEDQSAYVARANWSDAETVEVVLNEYAFEPSTLRFAAGQTYRLRLTNTGGSTHFFVSDGFFRSIAVQSLGNPPAPDDPVWLTSIVLPAGATREMTFVPVVPGTYALECTAPFHATFGMTGEITVSES